MLISWFQKKDWTEGWAKGKKDGRTERPKFIEHLSHGRESKSLQLASMFEKGFFVIKVSVNSFAF